MLKSPPPLQCPSFEGVNVGRGNGVPTVWVGDIYKEGNLVTTVGLTVWHINEYRHFELPSAHHGHFHSGIKILTPLFSSKDGHITKDMIWFRIICYVFCHGKLVFESRGCKSLPYTDKFHWNVKCLMAKHVTFANKGVHDLFFRSLAAPKMKMTIYGCRCSLEKQTAPYQLFSLLLFRTLCVIFLCRPTGCTSLWITPSFVRRLSCAYARRAD